MLAGSSDQDEDAEAAESSETDADITIGELENPTRTDEDPDGITNIVRNMIKLLGYSLTHLYMSQSCAGACANAFLAYAYL